MSDPIEWRYRYDGEQSVSYSTGDEYAHVNLSSALDEYQCDAMAEALTAIAERIRESKRRKAATGDE